jgi:hypothetical protein
LTGNEILDQPDLDWKKVYNLPFKVTKKTKLQWLQYRINHHILVTNHLLLCGSPLHTAEVSLKMKVVLLKVILIL